MAITIGEFREIQKLFDAVIAIPHNMIANDYGTPDSCPYCLCYEGKPHRDDCELENLKILAKKLKETIQWKQEFNGFIIPEKEKS